MIAFSSGLVSSLVLDLYEGLLSAFSRMWSPPGSLLFSTAEPTRSEDKVTMLS